MTELIALISIVVCLLFTWVASKEKTVEHGQSIRESMIEARENIFWGFLINWTANLIILPIYVDEVNMWQAFLMGWPYTVISLFRQFIIRRKNNKREIARERERDAKHLKTT